MSCSACPLLRPAHKHHSIVTATLDTKSDEKPDSNGKAGKGNYNLKTECIFFLRRSASIRRVTLNDSMDEN